MYSRLFACRLYELFYCDELIMCYRIKRTGARPTTFKCNMNRTGSPILDVPRESGPVKMDSISRSSVDREKEIPQTPNKASHGYSGAYPCCRENSAGDNNKTTNNSSQRVEELEKLIRRLNNAMLTLEEENLQLHKRLRLGKLEMNAQEAAPVDHSGRFRDIGAFSSEKTDGDSSATSPLQEDGHSQLKMENNSSKRKLKEAEKSSKQCGRDLHKLLQKYEDLKAKNQILEQHNSQLATDKKALEEKLYSLRSEKMQDEKMEVLSAKERAATRMGSQTGGCHSMLSFDNKGLSTHDGFSMSSLTTGQGEGSEALSETMACLKEENQMLKEELRQSTERGTQAEEYARRLQEEQAILENCLQTVQEEKDLLQVEVRALHQDYINLSDSITLQLRERANGDDKAPEASGSRSYALNHALATFREGNTKSAEPKETNLGVRRSTGSVIEKAPSMRRCTSSDSISLQLKDKESGARRSTGSTPDKAPDDCMRTTGQKIKTSINGNRTQTVKQGHIGGAYMVFLPLKRMVVHH